MVSSKYVHNPHLLFIPIVRSRNLNQYRHVFQIPLSYFNRVLSYVHLMDESQTLQDMKVAARLDYKEAQNFLKDQGISW